jgi:hypothetical protein
MTDTGGMWEIEGIDEFEAWFLALSAAEAAAVIAVVDLLAQSGPSLRRPLVGHIKGSRHANMRELIVTYGDLRILFAFDPRRTAILLLGGSKTDQWTAWYEKNVPVADERYDAYLAELRKEGLL